MDAPITVAYITQGVNNIFEAKMSTYLGGEMNNFVF